MKKVEELSGHRITTRVYPHYRADVYAAHLAEVGCNMEQIVILRKDGKSPGFLHDINQVSVKYPNSDPANPYLEIESGRNGIYDSLPEDLFYSPDHSHKERDKATIVRRFRANREAEGSVRHFLKLFEVESDQVLSSLQAKHIKYDKCYSYRDASDIFSPHWDIISIMSAGEAQRFLKVVPHTARIRGQLSEISAAISFILGLQIEMKYEYLSAETLKQTPNLSEMYLGDNSVMYSKETENSESAVLAIVSELELELCRDFFEGKRGDKILRFLIELFSDVNTSFRLEINPKREYCHFMFGVQGNEPYLDVNTYL